MTRPLSRRFGLLVALVAAAVVVVLVTWSLPGPDQPDLTAETLEVTIDPANAVATILELRGELGSVLEDAEFLGEARHDGAPSPETPASFDELLWAETGVPASERPGGPAVVLGEEELAKSGSVPQVSDPAGGESSAQPLHLAAAQLRELADRAQATGNVARQQRLSGLAMLLQAEADGLTAKPAP